RSDRLDVRSARVVHWDRGDLGDDADAWTDEPAQVRDLARDVEADLDHRDLVCRLETKERQRDADLVVERRRGPQHAVARTERRRSGLLRRRLADVTGDADGGDRMRVAHGLGQPPQRVERL